MPAKSEPSPPIWHDPDDAPEITEADLALAKWRIGDRTVGRAEAQAEMARRAGHPPAAPPKQAVTLRLDPDILAHFRATGPGWQTRINAILRKAAGLDTRDEAKG